MSKKRFTVCHEQNDIRGWTMSIVDWETDQSFDYAQYEVHSESITATKEEMEDLCLLLNQLNDENEKLKSDRHRFEEECRLEITDHMDRVSDLIDEKIREYKQYDEYDTEKYYIGTQLLKELKKELIE